MNIDDVIEELVEKVGQEADDVSRWTQAESAEIYQGVADECRSRAKLIESEMDDED